MISSDQTSRAKSLIQWIRVRQAVKWRNKKLSRSSLSFNLNIIIILETYRSCLLETYRLYLLETYRSCLLETYPSYLLDTNCSFLLETYRLYLLETFRSYILVSDDILVSNDIRWYLMVYNGIQWYSMVSNDIQWYPMISMVSNSFQSHWRFITW